MVNQNSRKTHCKDGHPFDAVNTIIKRLSTGARWRVCRTCARLQWQTYELHKRKPKEKPNGAASLDQRTG